MDILFLAQQFYEYSLHIRGYSKDTIRRYKYVIGFYCKYSGVRKIEDVTLENIRALFLFGRTERNWKTNTYIVFYKSLKVFFNWCIERELLKQNYIQAIEVPKLEKPLPPKLNKQDTLKLLEVVYNYPYDYTFLRYRNHAIFSTFIFAGLRKSELLNLKLTDVDLENLSIFVFQGKGQKDRIIPISFTLALSLRKYLDERKRLKKTCPYFFASLNRDMGLTNAGLKNLTDHIRKASNLRFTIHQLRHTFATMMLEGGCDIYSLSKMMGHANIQTTTIYLAASAELLRSQMTKHPLNNM